MNNAVMLTKDRPLLTRQAIDSFLLHSKLEWNLTIVDDDSSFQTRAIVARYTVHDNVRVVEVGKGIANTALLRNLGVYFSEHFFGRGDYLYLSDNDACYTDGWDVVMETAIHLLNEFKVMGPYRHPYHHPNGVHYAAWVEVVETDAVQGIGHFMKWETWDKWGPLVEHRGVGMGTNQSEDYEFCQRIVKDGFKVGSVQPNVVHNCGLTGTNGAASPGAEVIEKEKVKGVYYL